MLIFGRACSILWILLCVVWLTQMMGVVGTMIGSLFLFIKLPEDEGNEVPDGLFALFMLGCVVYAFLCN